MFYIILYLSIILLGILFRNKCIKYKNIRINIFIFIVALVLIIIAAIRGNDVGIDTSSYISIHEMLNKGLSVNVIHEKYASTIEFGYLYFCKIIIMLSHNRVFFFRNSTYYYYFWDF